MIELKAKKREIFGKKLRSPREDGLLPVVVYGAGKDATPLFVETKDFLKVWKQAGESAIVSLNADGQKHDVLIQEVSFHSVSDKPLHADFYMVAADQLIRVSVPIKFTGVAPAVKTFGGVLVKVLHEILVEALPANLPQELSADVSKIVNLEDRVLVKDIKIPAQVKVMASIDDVVALVSVSKEEVDETAEPIDLTKIEVEKKGKKPEEGEAAVGEAPAKATAKAGQAAAPKK